MGEVYTLSESADDYKWSAFSERKPTTMNIGGKVWGRRKTRGPRRVCLPGF